MRILIVGLGSAGLRHAKNLIALGETDLWGYDPDAERMRAAVELGLKPAPELPSMQYFYCAAVLVCTPPDTHAYWAQRALECSIDHLFIEKPLDINIAAAELLLRDTARYRVKISVGYQLRWHRGLLHTRYHWDEIGHCHTVLARFGQYLPDWRPGTDWRQNYITRLGLILEQSHEIDYLRWLCGEVKSVYCQASYGGLPGMEGETGATIILEHETGTVSTIVLDCLRRGYERTAQFVGTEGTILWDYRGSWQLLTNERKIVRNMEADPAYTYRHELAHFLKCCRGEAEPVCTGADGLAVVRICHAVLESARCGVRVNL